MSEKTFLCTVCGSWNLNGRFFNARHSMLWVCDPCQYKAILRAHDES